MLQSDAKFDLRAYKLCSSCIWHILLSRIAELFCAGGQCRFGEHTSYSGFFTEHSTAALKARVPNVTIRCNSLLTQAEDG